MSEPKNIKSLWNKYKAALIVGVISSIIVSILGRIFRAAPAVGKTFVDTIINVFYSMAAETDASTLVVMLFMFFILFFATFSISTLIYSYISRKIDREMSESNPSKIPKTQYRTKYTRLKLFICTLLFVIYTTVAIYFPVVIHMNFNRDITIIKPYTDAQTILVLESDWARMRSKSDYDKIYQIINEVKEKNNIPKR